MQSESQEATASSWSGRSVRAAFVFLTRIPVGGGVYTDAEWRRAVGHFPLVGIVLGVALASLAWVLVPHLGATVSAVSALAASLLLTGAFHEDGLADTADALGGAFEREKLFAILKDSRIGAYGAASLALTLALRGALLARLDAAMPLGLLLSQGVARLPAVALMRALPYVSSASPVAEPKSRLVARAGAAELRIASFWVALLLLACVLADALSPARLLCMAGALTVVTAALGRRFRARAGGITGDFLGATEQVAECVVLFVLAWR
ncbi:MAG: adenosylcobinamide-GDP ribazoletransferase [Polyangiales bacterium]